jgi:hypothetical protein
MNNGRELKSPESRMWIAFTLSGPIQNHLMNESPTILKRIMRTMKSEQAVREIPVPMT